MIKQLLNSVIAKYRDLSEQGEVSRELWRIAVLFFFYLTIT